MTIRHIAVMFVTVIVVMAVVYRVTFLRTIVVGA